MSDSIPAVDIIIPVYNDETRVLDAVQSAISQKDCSVNCIVVNDGSTDQTERKLMESGVFQRITYVSKPNGGVASARNRGLDVATAEFCCFLDSDDILHEDFCAEMTVRLRESHGLAAFCGFDFVGADGQTLLEGLTPDQEAKDISLGEILVRNRFMTPCVMLRRSAFPDLRFREQLRYNEDWVFWIDVGERVHEFCAVKRRLVKIRTTTTGLTSQVRKLAPNYLKALRVISSKVNQNQLVFDKRANLVWADHLRSLGYTSKSLVFFARSLPDSLLSIDFLVFIAKFTGDLVGIKKLAKSLGLIKPSRIDTATR